MTPDRVVQLTEAQRAALRWLKAHNGDGVFDRDGVLLAAGERAPVMRSTWNALAEAGFVEFYADRRRVRACQQEAGR
ncbi:hypothetical protein ACRAVF_19315 [Bradyrhizobium oligotrophicum S58]